MKRTMPSSLRLLCELRLFYKATSRGDYIIENFIYQDVRDILKNNNMRERHVCIYDCIFVWMYGFLLYQQIIQTCHLHIYYWHCWAVLSLFSHVWLFVTLWTVAHQVPLSMAFCRQYVSDTGVGCHFLLQGSSPPREPTCFSDVSGLDRQVL